MPGEAGAKYVIIGHSERRQYYNETDFTVNKKVHAALEVGLNPIVCVGESLEQRELAVTMELIAYPGEACLGRRPADKMRHVVIAYEPLWAIGTGKTATAEQAGEVCQAIRAVIRKLYGARVARSVTIQYGGSMNPKNAAELLAQPDVDGGLIGGASPDPCGLRGDHQRRQPGSKRAVHWNPTRSPAMGPWGEEEQERSFRRQGVPGNGLLR